MSKDDREIDPDYIRQFQFLLDQDREHIEDHIIPILRDGKLSHGPALGLDEVETKKAEYNESFRSIWNDLQHIKSTLKRMNEELDGTLENHEYTEDVSTTDIDKFLLQGEAPPPDPDSAPPSAAGGDAIPH